MEEIEKENLEWTLEVMGVSPKIKVTILKMPMCYDMGVVERSSLSETGQIISDMVWLKRVTYWEPFTVSFVNTNPDDTNDLLKWASSGVSNPKTGMLKCSNGNEWKIEKMWTQAASFINFSDFEEVELTFVSSAISVHDNNDKLQNKKLLLKWENK